VGYSTTLCYARFRVVCEHLKIHIYVLHNISQRIEAKLPETRISSDIEAFWIDPRKYTSFSIPWGKFEEMEIQAVIKLLFESKGFTVHWRHSEDRIHEEGADLVCFKGNKSVAIAVKKKPLKKDLYQLLELNDFKSDEKIYVYSGEATVVFEEVKKKYPEIAFWTFSDLQENLMSEAFEIGFDLVVDNMPFTIECLRLFQNIRSFVISSRGLEKVPKLPVNQKKVLISILWNLKDRISVLHKGCKVLQAVFESKVLPENMNSQKIISIFSVGLNFLLNDSLQQFNTNMDTILKEWKPFLIESYLRTNGRSNWRIFQDLPPFDFLHVFQPGAVIEKSLQIEKQDQLFKHIPKEMIDSEKISPQDLLENRIRLISNFFGDVEKILDDLFDVVNAK